MPLPPRSILESSSFSSESLSQKTHFCPSCQLRSLNPLLKKPCPTHAISFIHCAGYAHPSAPFAGIGMDFGHSSSGRNISLPVPPTYTATARTARATLKSSQVYAVYKAVEKARELVVNSLREMDKLKFPGRVRSMVAQVGDDWQADNSVNVAPYTTPIDTKEVCILTSSSYFLDSITLEDAPWRFARPGPKSRTALSRSTKKSFPSSAATSPKIVTNYRPSTSWFKTRKFASPLDWDLLKEIDYLIADINKRGVLVSFCKVKKEGRKDRALVLAKEGAKKGSRVID